MLVNLNEIDKELEVWFTDFESRKTLGIECSSKPFTYT